MTGKKPKIPARVNLITGGERSGKTKRIRDAVEKIIETPVDDAIFAVDDNDDEFGSDSFREDGEVRKVLGDLTGNRGISGATDLTPIQAVMLTHWRVLMESYPDDVFYLGLAGFPDWFETYRLSINRGSRKENVEILRGNVNITPPPSQLGPPGLR